MWQFIKKELMTISRIFVIALFSFYGSHPLTTLEQGCNDVKNVIAHIAFEK